MLINNLGSLSASQRTDVKKTDAKLLAAIASIVSGKATQDVADLAIATQLQSQVAGLKQVSQNIAQAASLTQVADGAIEQSQRIVARLQAIAQQAANGTTSDTDRAALNEEFQNLVVELDRQVASTQFNGQNLLDGTLSGDSALSLSDVLADDGGEGDSTLDINSLSTDVLFNGRALDVRTAEAAQAALAALGTAQTTISTARASVGSFQQTLNYSAASIDSAIINQQAAQSLLSDADFLEVVTESQNAQVQRNAQLSLAAQTNRLPATLLQLVS